MANDKHTAADEKASEADIPDWENGRGLNIHERQAYKFGFLAGIAHERKKAAKLVEALEFYADERTYSEEGSFHEMDMEGFNHEIDCGTAIDADSGRIAAEALAAYKGSTDGK